MSRAVAGREARAREGLRLLSARTAERARRLFGLLFFAFFGRVTRTMLRVCRKKATRQGAVEAAALSLLAAERALDRHRTRKRSVGPRDSAHAAIVLAPDSNERSIHVESAQRHVMDTALNRCCGVPHPLLELTIVDALSSAPTALVELVGELEHQLHVARELCQVRPFLEPALVRIRSTSGLIGLRDRALITLGFAGGFRRSELVALNCDDLRYASGGLR